MDNAKSNLEKIIRKEIPSKFGLIFIDKDGKQSEFKTVCEIGDIHYGDW